MKQIQINRAYGALTKLMSMTLPVRDSYSIFTVAKKLEDNYKFELEQERKLLSKYNGKYGKQGEIIFANSEDAEGFKNESIELSNIEVDMEIEPVEISFDSFGDQQITPNDILCLDGFVKFI